MVVVVRRGEKRIANKETVAAMAMPLSGLSLGGCITDHPPPNPLLLLQSITLYQLLPASTWAQHGSVKASTLLGDAGYLQQPWRQDSPSAQPETFSGMPHTV